MNRFIQLHDVGYPSLYLYDREDDRLIDLDSPRFVARKSPLEVMVNPDLVEEVQRVKYECKNVVCEKVRIDRFGLFHRIVRKVVPYLMVSPTFVRLVSGKVLYVSERPDEIEKMVAEATK